MMTPLIASDDTLDCLHHQVIELYSDDGLSRPLLLMLDTPDQGSVVRIVNTAPMEFPLAA